VWPYIWWYPWAWSQIYPYYGYLPYSLPYTWPMMSIPKEQELAWLRDQERMYEEELKLIRERIKELEGKTK